MGSMAESLRTVWAPVVLLLGALLVATAPCAAQTSRGASRRDPLDRALHSAQTLLRHRQIDEAIQLLEKLHETHPSDGRVRLSLGAAYKRAGRYDEAAVLYRQEIERTEGRDASTWIQLADAERLGGRGALAITTLLEALRRHPAWARRFRDQFELATMDTLAGAEAFGTLRTQAASPEAPPVWRDALAHVYVVHGEYAQAIDIMMQLEREKRSSAQPLLRLARTLADRADPATALAAYDSVLALDPKRAVAEEAWFGKGRILEQSARPVEAAATYAEQVRRYPQGTLAARAHLQRAALLVGSLDDLAGARESYAAILETIGPKPGKKTDRAMREEALLGVGECDLRAGEFVNADSTFAKLERDGIKSATRERAAFERAEILFYQGKFVEAEELYYNLTDNHTGGVWVNDALERVLLLGEFGLQSGTALQTYAQVRYHRRVGEPEEALRLSRGGVKSPGQAAMRDYLRFEELQLCGELGRWAEADSVLALLLEADAPSRRAPQAILWAAEAAMALPERHELAAGYFEDVIVRYPDSLEARVARRALRELRSGGESS